MRRRPHDTDGRPVTPERPIDMLPVAAPWFPVGDDRVRLLRDGGEALPAMLDAIARAEHEVLLEMYWIGNDPVGRQFRDALEERARAGLKVCVIYDALGSLGVTLDWWAPFVASGGRVAEFHGFRPLDPRFRFAQVELRDHRKLLVVDRLCGFTGGLNLASPWLPFELGGGGWRDDMVEVRGGAAQELRTLFYRTWRRLTRERPPVDLSPISRTARRPVRLLASPRRKGSIHYEYLVRIAGAKESIDIANSYFVPDRRVRAALFRAVRRGVRVRVLVPRKGDVLIVQLAVEASFERMMRRGVEIWAFPDRMLHAKTAIIDDEFTTIGSFNLDRRSWRKNLEANLVVQDAAFARHVRSWFERDLQSSLRIDPIAWRQRSLARRGLEWISYAARRLW
jgi:cardiolipin synthase A/B